MPDTPENARDSSTDPVAILFPDSVQFERGRIVLGRAGLIVKSSQPGGNFGALGVAYGFPSVSGTLWVAPENLDRAVKLLEEFQVPAAVAGPPLLDPDQQICPNCGYPLYRIASNVCPECGMTVIRHEPLPAEVSSTEPSEPRRSRSARRRRRLVWMLLMLLFFSSLPWMLIGPIGMLFQGPAGGRFAAALVLTVLVAIGLKIGRGFLSR